MFNIKKVKRLEARIKELEMLNMNFLSEIAFVNSRLDWYKAENVKQRNETEELAAIIESTGVIRDSKGRFQSIDTQL